MENIEAAQNPALSGGATASAEKKDFVISPRRPNYLGGSPTVLCVQRTPTLVVFTADLG